MFRRRRNVSKCNRRPLGLFRAVRLGQGFGHVYLMTFADAAARDAYLVHPDHQAFVAAIGPLLDAALVLDYTPQPVACTAGA